MTILTAKTPQELAQIGASLRSSLYAPSLDIRLSGDLGTGKTTFLQGFLRGMGVKEAALSPTYAIEHRYETTDAALLHIDLYRLSEQEAVRHLMETDDFPGIRCIEWSERSAALSRPTIAVGITEDPRRTRHVTFAFGDLDLPTDEVIHGWRHDVGLPEAIRRHCDAVAELSSRLANALLRQGTVVRKDLAETGARLHDLFRFLDFKPGAAHVEETETAEQHRRWDAARQLFTGLSHEAACARFLQNEGFPELARVIETHGLGHPPQTNATTEQLLLFYADKRVLSDQVVSVQERFEDFRRRYGESPLAHGWREKTLEAETILFPGGVPF